MGLSFLLQNKYTNPKIQDNYAILEMLGLNKINKKLFWQLKQLQDNQDSLETQTVLTPFRF